MEEFANDLRIALYHMVRWLAHLELTRALPDLQSAKVDAKKKQDVTFMYKFIKVRSRLHCPSLNVRGAFRRVLAQRATA